MRTIGFLILCLLTCSAIAATEPTAANFLGLRGNGLSFTPNKGQIVDASGKLRPDILFEGDGGGVKVYLRKTGISYVLSDVGKVLGAFRKKYKTDIRAKRRVAELRKLEEAYLREHPVTVQRVDLDLEGTNSDFVIETADPVEGYNNYYYGHCSNGITHVAASNRVTYKNIYDGVDIIFYGDKGNGLKYDIVVHSGADPSRVKWICSGANKLTLMRDTLQILTKLVTMKDFMPDVYQVGVEGRKEVKAKYGLKKLREKTYEISYTFASYDPTQDLVIDPYNFWITYYGGSGTDYPVDIINDDNGDVIVYGTSVSVNFPTSPGAFQTSSSMPGPFVLKMSNSGNRLWCTYYCSQDNYDNAYGVAHDHANNVYITGITYSSNFPVSSGCFQPVFGGNIDAFLVKFNSSGQRVWGTYFGKANFDYGMAVTCTPNNDPVVAGYTDDSSFYITPGVVQSVSGGLGDCFVSRFSGGGNLIWSTYCGGGASESPNHVKSDMLGNIVIGGDTYSNDFPVSSGAYQSTLIGGMDGFLVKLNNTGTTTIFSTYYGGNEVSYDLVQSMAIDMFNNILVLGWTSASDLSVTPGTYQTSYGGGSADDYVAKFSPGGSLKWATYYGNSYWEWPGGIAVDNHNDILVWSEWEDDAFVNLPVLGCAYQKSFGGTEDQFLVKLDSAGATQKCFTYLGGPDEDDLDVSMHTLSYYNGSFFFATVAFGQSYPITSNAYQTISGDTVSGGWVAGDVIIGKLCATSCGDTSNNKPDYSYTSQYCAGSPTAFFGWAAPCDTNGVQYSWEFQSGTPGTSTQLNPISAFSTPGSHTVTFKVTTPCSSDSITKTINLITAANCSLNGTMAAGNVCPGSCVNVSVNPSGGTPPYVYSWTPNLGGGPGPYNVCPNATTVYSCVVTDNAGSQVTLSQTVGVNSPVPFTSHASVTSGSLPLSVTFSAQPVGTGNHYHWQCEDHFNSYQNSYTYTFDTAGVYEIYVVHTDANGCQNADTIFVTVTEPVVTPVSSLEVPNIFTPNKDSTNDIFALNLKNITSINMVIFNRWGQIVAELKTPAATWDGRTEKGDMCSDGTYYYILEAKGIDDKQYKQRGFITLLR